MKSTIELIPYVLLIAWCIFSIYYLLKARRSPEKINPHIFETIPQVFPTLGILGTFLGIAYGLFYFDVKNMSDSIPELLNGLKTAFIASIFGIIGLLIFSKLTAIVQRQNEKDKTITSDEVEALNILIDITKKTGADTTTQFKALTNSIIGNSDESLSTQFAKLRNLTNEQTDKLSRIQSALGGDGETSLLTQIQKLRAEQNEYSKVTLSNTTYIVETINKNNEILKTKFDEFSKLLSENNTKALVDAVQSVIKDFNTQMNELIQKLVQENFQELNNSVKNLNDWQKENRNNIELLINQFNQVTSNLESSSKSITEISSNTKALTDSNSSLSKMIVELQSVMIEDRKFKETINALNTTSKNVESSSLQLSEYMKKEKGFQESINLLLDKLKEIETIKDTNKAFWKDIESKMKEGVNIISTSNEKLARDVQTLDEDFKKRLTTSFMSLDKVLQTMVLDYKKATLNVIEDIKR